MRASIMDLLRVVASYAKVKDVGKTINQMEAYSALRL